MKYLLCELTIAIWVKNGIYSTHRKNREMPMEKGWEKCEYAPIQCVTVQFARCKRNCTAKHFHINFPKNRLQFKANNMR